jgi:hypothetical protein
MQQVQIVIFIKKIAIIVTRIAIILLIKKISKKTKLKTPNLMDKIMKKFLYKIVVIKYLINTIKIIHFKI